jgi:radical SAM protein with 4Fe4S-binding SPASM domain
MGNARMKEENVMGNAFREKLNKIWNGKKYQEFREKMKSNKPPESCRKCPKFYGQ